MSTFLYCVFHALYGRERLVLFGLFVNRIFVGSHLFEYGDAVEVKSSHKVLFV